MPFSYRRRARATPRHTTHTTHRRGIFPRRRAHATQTTHRRGIFPRRRAHATQTTQTTTTTTVVPQHHHHRRPSFKDKVSGALMKVRGSLTRRPGLKAAGTRRMHGTDGRGSHHRHNVIV